MSNQKMKFSSIVRNYGGFILSHYQEAAVANGDAVTASMLQEYGADVLQSIAGALEAKEQQGELIDRSSFVAREAIVLMYHKDIDPEEAVRLAIDVMQLSERIVAEKFFKKADP